MRMKGELIKYKLKIVPTMHCHMIELLTFKYKE